MRARPRVVICERGESVVLSVRRALAGLPVPTVRTTSPEDALAELAQPGATLLAVDLNERTLAAGLELIHRARGRSDCRTVAVLARGLEPFELLARELGAVHVTVSARNLAPLRAIVEPMLAATQAEQAPFATSFGDAERMYAEAIERLNWTAGPSELRRPE